MQSLYFWIPYILGYFGYVSFIANNIDYKDPDNKNKVYAFLIIGLVFYLPIFVLWIVGKALKWFYVTIRDAN